MTPSPQSNTVADKLWIFALAVGLPVLAMLLLGLDANWDLRNYHLYNPHAWLTGRMDTDIAPAQLQSWHNPLLDVPLYLIISSGPNARWASAWLTLPYIASIYFLLRLQLLLSPSPPFRLSQTILALLALTGAATFSTLATSFNDGFVAAAMLASLLLILNQEHGGDSHRRWLLAGIVAGAITGLKLSAAFYCIGLAFSTFIDGRSKETFLRLCNLALGGATGFALTYGYWGWQLLAAHRNPFFPYYNNVFHSPDALANSFADSRFRPESLLDALLVPIRLLHRSQRFSEPGLSDPRLLIGLLALASLFVFYRKRFPIGSALRRRIGILLVFFITSLLFWIGQYGIYRYAIVLELLGCLALVVLLQGLPRGRNIALLMAALLVTADTKHGNWGHVATAAPMAGIKPPAIPGDSLVVIASDEPLAYLVLGLPGSVPLIAVSNNLMSPENCTRLQRRAQQTIAHHPGPIWLLDNPTIDKGQGQSLVAGYYGLRPAGACVPFTNSLATAQLCPQRRTPVDGHTCPARP